MADKHPYISAPGPLIQSLEQLRKAFPATVTSETLKKLGLAPGNESFVINILKFVGLLDEKGARTVDGQKVFSLHTDTEFRTALADLIEKAYRDLFSLHSQAAWDLDRDRLISFFRTSDQTSALVGQRQAITFRALAAFAGHGDAPATQKTPTKEREVSSRPVKSSNQTSTRRKPMEQAKQELSSKSPVGLTVRIEINLPSQGDQETYDKIFASIRENLLNAQ